MTLYPIARSRYDAGKDAGGSFFSEEFPDCFFLPEGGNTAAGSGILCGDPRRNRYNWRNSTQIADNLLYLCTPAGTGCTAAGIVAGLRSPLSEVLIFPVSRHGLDEPIIRNLPPAQASTTLGLKTRFSLLYDYTFGGFANYFRYGLCRSFYQQTNILLDPVYTAKMCSQFFDLLEKGHFQEGSTIVVLHTGGQQGWDGFSA